MSIEIIDQSNEFEKQISDTRIADYNSNPNETHLIENSNETFKDKRIFETPSSKTKPTKRPKFNWGMNIVKDILKSNLASNQNESLPLPVPISLTKESLKPIINNNNNKKRSAVKQKHSIRITVKNSMIIDEETPKKRLRTSSLEIINQTDSRLVINACKNERIVIQDDTKTSKTNENDDIEIIEIIESQRIQKEITTTVNNEDNDKKAKVENNHEEKQVEESYLQTIDSLFKKTTSKPSIYWAPVSMYRVIKWYENKPV